MSVPHRSLVAALLAAFGSASAQIVFEPPREEFVTHAGPTAIGDIDEDGIPDAVGGTAPSLLFDPGSFTPLIGQGDGTFVAGAPVVLGTASGAGLTLVDWNGDGHLDVVHAGGGLVFVQASPTCSRSARAAAASRGSRTSAAVPSPVSAPSTSAVNR